MSDRVKSQPNIGGKNIKQPAVPKVSRIGKTFFSYKNKK